MDTMKYKVLLIEDNEIDQVAFERLVEKGILSYDYCIAGSVSEAKELLALESFEAVIVDYMLGDGTAFDIIDCIPGIPFIIVTGAGDEDIAVKAMKAGAHEYLIKDIERNYLKVLPLILEKAIFHKKKEGNFKLMSYAIMSINDSVYFTDMENIIIFVNNAFCKTYGYDKRDIIGKSCDILMENVFPGIERIDDLSAIAEKDIWYGEAYHKRRDGIVFPVYLSRSIIKDESGRELGIVNIVRDITEKKLIEKRLERMAYFDDLTGLPNRTLFYDHLNKLLAQAKRDNRILAVLFLDLDRFKVVNDTLGHNVGDFLLKTVAKRIKKDIRDADIIARLGGDEFAIILANINKHQNAANVAQRVINCFEKPFHFEKNYEYTIGVSIGITVYPFDGGDVDTLVKNADTAMYHAKGNGRNTYQFYNIDMNTLALRQFTIENKLRDAIKRDEFLLHYQPLVDAKTKKIIGTEALIRWQSLNYEMISPDKFIPVAEETGLIIPIGEWVLRTACRQGKAWQKAGFPPLPVSINISARQFNQQNLIDTVYQILHETGFDPHLLEIELTESTLMHNEESILMKLKMLTEKGIKLSIDDFGTGYSSIGYLKRLPIYKLKIDKSFVNDIMTDSNDRAISEAIITMAHRLQIKVIAEGVETEEQLKILHSLGCDEVQGYLFYKPLPAEELTDILSRELIKIPDER